MITERVKLARETEAKPRNRLHRPIVLEDHSGDGVEWGLSFQGPNPESADYVAVRTREEAFRAINLVGTRLRIAKLAKALVLLNSPLAFFALVALCFVATMWKHASNPTMFAAAVIGLACVVVCASLLAVFRRERLLAGSAETVLPLNRAIYGVLVMKTDGECSCRISFSGPNPKEDEWIAVNSRKDAAKLVELAHEVLEARVFA